LLSGGNDSAVRKNDAGRSGYHLMWIFLCIAPIFQKSRISFEKKWRGRRGAQRLRIRKEWLAPPAEIVEEERGVVPSFVYSKHSPFQSAMVSSSQIFFL
jgi:hypothetical protein